MERLSYIPLIDTFDSYSEHFILAEGQNSWNIENYSTL